MVCGGGLRRWLGGGRRVVGAQLGRTELRHAGAVGSGDVRAAEDPQLDFAGLGDLAHRSELAVGPVVLARGRKPVGPVGRRGWGQHAVLLTGGRVLRAGVKRGVAQAADERGAVVLVAGGGESGGVQQVIAAALPDPAAADDRAAPMFKVDGHDRARVRRALTDRGRRRVRRGAGRSDAGRGRREDRRHHGLQPSSDCPGQRRVVHR